MIPKIEYAQKMREKSNCYILGVDFQVGKSNLRPTSIILCQDSSRSDGMTEVLKGYIPYIPTVTETGQVRAKILIQGAI